MGRRRRRAHKREGHESSGESDGSGEENDLLPLEGVVKLFTVHSEPNFSQPWVRRRQSRSVGSGFAISGRRVLTNSHCVEYATQVQVKRRGEDTKYLAKVLAVGWECDLALLSVEDPAFWKGMQEVKFTKHLPHLDETAICCGYPMGGETMSLTSGVVSRLEVTEYCNVTCELLGIQIDAAINDGNSGGPAFNEKGKCMGVAFQSIGASEAENIGYIIPVPVVEHFLQDVKSNGEYTGFPSLGVQWQTMESPALRRAFGLSSKGILVTRVHPTGSTHGVLELEDVILGFDGSVVGNDATVKFRKHERVAFSWLVSQKFAGDRATVQVLRKGETLDLEFGMHLPKPLVPPHLWGKDPSYFVCGGLVFTPLTVPYLRGEYGEEWESDAPVDLVCLVEFGRPRDSSEERVVLVHVLAHDCTVGYDDVEKLLVKKVNGTVVHNLQHLVDLTVKTECEWITFHLSEDKVVVLQRESVMKDTREVLAQHTIPAPVSPDLVLPQLPAESASGAADGADVPPEAAEVADA